MNEDNAPVTCMRCNAVVADPYETGFLCASCKAVDQAPRDGWRSWVPPSAVPGAIAAAVGFSFSMSYFVNGRGLDIVAFVCGVIAIASGVLGVGQSLRARSPSYRGALAVVALGLFHVVWRSALLTLL